MSSFEYLRDGDSIYARSFQIIRAEADLSRFSVEEEVIAVRMIHACGQVEAAAAFRFAPGFVAAGHAAIAKSGAMIFADTDMVARGITRSRLPAGVEIVCTLRDPRVQDMAKLSGDTRSAAALSLWGDRIDGALVVIGNAPTALFRLLEMIAAGGPRPAAIIGMPVGFVGAVESKEALVRGHHGIPYAVVDGRMGGSAMAAAAVNALAKDRL